LPDPDADAITDGPVFWAVTATAQNIIVKTQNVFVINLVFVVKKGELRRMMENEKNGFKKLTQ
jgi:hypothetical protein